MGYVKSCFPNQIWDGKTPNPEREEGINADCNPNTQDWDRIAAEIIAMQKAIIGGTAVSTDISVTAGEVLHAGQPVYVKQSDIRAYVAKASFEETSRVCGFVKTDTTAEGCVSIVPIGKLELVNWSIALGGNVFLIAGAIYYLSDVIGQIVVNPPSTGFVIQVGVAVTPMVLDVNIKTRVRL
jgi:hypothetical protein